ncbi:hypothetical protein [Streptomyces sp. NPDC048106]|uniref:hypothetical protein n=1 Tax=Streptomyces sp. NPDC048106 TaxID=3155750 RepID=UPI003456ABDE
MRHRRHREPRRQAAPDICGGRTAQTKASIAAVTRRYWATGMLALLHGASSSGMRMLKTDDIDQRTPAVRLGKRPHLVPVPHGRAEPRLNCLAFPH